jgi:signal transduction histidine kinase
MRHIAHSVFTKLVIVLAVTGILINLAVFGFLASALHKIDKHPFRHDLVHYARHLANEIGVPPDHDEAKKIAKQSLFQIVYKGADSTWSTSDQKYPINQMSFRPVSDDPGMEIGSFRKYHAFKLEHGIGSLIFISSFQFARDQIGGGHFVFLLLILTSIVAFTWLVLRSILKPLKWLSTGVEQVSAGNLEHRVPESRKDELGDLTSAFNTMTTRIEQMLTARKRLLLDVSHELRSPLTRINVALEDIHEGKPKDTIKADIREMEHMITEILETERLMNTGNNLNIQDVDMTRLVREAVSHFKDQLPPIIPSHIFEDVSCMADRELALIVIKNLFSNALKYSAPDALAVDVSVFKETDWVVIKIRDYGEGIPTEDLPHIFEPFYRVDKSRSRKTGGYGLGLNLCKTIMDSHGGKIEIKSNVPVAGSEVILRFPLVPPEL